MKLPPEFHQALLQTNEVIRGLNALAAKMEQCLQEADEPLVHPLSHAGQLEAKLSTDTN